MEVGEVEVFKAVHAVPDGGVDEEGDGGEGADAVVEGGEVAVACCERRLLAEVGRRGRAEVGGMVGGRAACCGLWLVVLFVGRKDSPKKIASEKNSSPSRCMARSSERMYSFRSPFRMVV